MRNRKTAELKGGHAANDFPPSYIAETLAYINRNPAPYKADTSGFCKPEIRLLFLGSNLHLIEQDSHFGLTLHLFD